MMKYFRLIAAAGVVVFLLSSTMPWLTVSILGQFSITMGDVYRLISRAIQQRQAPSTTQANPTEAVAGYASSVGAILASIILYPVSAALGLVAVWARKVALPAGILAAASGILWIVGVDSLKSQLVQQAGSQGGIGGQLAAAFATALASAVQVGYGAYVAVVAGLMILVAFFVKAAGGQAATLGVEKGQADVLKTP